MGNWFHRSVLAMTLAVSACTSRTTPLPPPEVSSVSRPSDAGDVTVVGLALEGATVGVINGRTLEGVITTPEPVGCTSICEFRAVLRAEAGDPLRVWQFESTPGGIETFVPER